MMTYSDIFHSREWAVDGGFCHVNVPWTILGCAHLTESAVYNLLFGGKGREHHWKAGDKIGQAELILQQ
jgi:hypothetical protein